MRVTARIARNGTCTLEVPEGQGGGPVCKEVLKKLLDGADVLAEREHADYHDVPDVAVSENVDVGGNCG